MTLPADPPARAPRRPGRRPIIVMAVACILAAALAITLTVVQRPARAGVLVLDGSVLTNGGGLSYGGTITSPGTVGDFPLMVLNLSSSPVVLESATLLPLPGYPAPKLVHLGVLTEHIALLTSTEGWPPEKDGSPPSTWPLRPLRGYVVLPWATRRHRHLGPMPDMIEYGVVGTRTNTDYWAAGLRITYRAGLFTYTQDLYEGGRDCVGNVSNSRPASYQAVYNKYCAMEEQPGNNELMQIAPLSPAPPSSSSG